MIKLIIFDLWQTLAYRDVEFSTTSKMLEKTGLNIPKERFIKIFEESTQTKKWRSKKAAYANLCVNMGLKPTKTNVSLLMNIRDKAEAKTKLYSYTLPMLRQLQKLGYKTALVSNSSVFAIRQLKKRTKILKYIDYPLFSFDVGVIKPNLRFYRQLLKLTRFKPKEAIMIGDKEKDDVFPPRQIGMHSIHFKNYNQLKDKLTKLGIHLN